MDEQTAAVAAAPQGQDESGEKAAAHSAIAQQHQIGPQHHRDPGLQTGTQGDDGPSGGHGIPDTAGQTGTGSAVERNNADQRQERNGGHGQSGHSREGIKRQPRRANAGDIGANADPSGTGAAPGADNDGAGTSTTVG